MPRGTLRDLGGLPTASGRLVRSGVLLRSEAPITLSESERRQLAEVALVIDLRAHGEADDTMLVWGATGGPEVLHLPLVRHSRMYGVDVLVGMATDSDFARRFMTELYVELLSALQPSCLSEVAKRIGEEEQVPVLIHCTGGQDRSGVLVAVILLALGVSREQVVDDYVRSAESWNLDRMMTWYREALGSHAQPVEGAVEYLLARPEYIEAAIDRLLAEHGAIESYWASAGVNAAALDRVRHFLLTD